MLKKTLIVTLVLAGIVGSYLLYNYVNGNRTVTLELVLDSSIEKIEFYDVRDDENPIATIFPVFDGRRMEVPLRVYQDIQYQRTLHAIYYYFIIYKAGEGSKSNTFTVDKNGERAKLTILPSGSWQIVNQ